MAVCHRFDCPNEFEPKITGGRAKRFCSKACSLRWHHERNKAKKWRWATLVCPNCGVGFSTRTATKEYCTPHCQAEHYKTRPYYREQRHRTEKAYQQRNRVAVNARQRARRAKRNRCECGVLKPREQPQCDLCAAKPTAGKVLKW